MFTGKLPDPSRSFIPFESDFDLFNEEIFKSLQVGILQVCIPLEQKKISINKVTIKRMDGFGVNFQAIPFGRDKSVWIYSFNFCEICKINWVVDKSHPNNGCLMGDIDFVMST